MHLLNYYLHVTHNISKRKKMGKGIEFFLIFIFVLPSIHKISAIHYPINVWPKPTTFSWPQPQATLLSKNFTIHHPPENKYLQIAVDRYLKLFAEENYRPLVVPALNLTSSPSLQALNIIVSDIAAPLAYGVNESYTLSIPSPWGSTTATLSAQTVWGAMRGLETFSQLVYGKPTRVASALFVCDEPLYGHRGVVLDTSRNYYGVDHLLRLIKAMSMNKLNVFHWHITDSHSFPLLLPSEPKLAERGSYGDDMVYSPEDVKRVVEFGMEYGVRVMPEIDMPGE